MPRLIALMMAFLLSVAPVLADSTVNNLPVSPSITGTQIVYCPVGSTNDYKCTFSQIATFVNSTLIAAVNFWTGTNTFLGNTVFGANVTVISPGQSLTDMSVAINAALVSGAKVQLTCGSYFINNTVFMPSNSELAGAGPCTIIVGNAGMVTNPQWAAVGGGGNHAGGITNADFVNGNNHISVHDLTVDMSALVGQGFGVTFYKGSYANAYRLNLIGNTTNSDGIAFIQSDHYSVKDSTASRMGNACFDNWQGSFEFQITGNVCIGGGTVAYGILVNGLAGSNVGSVAMTTFEGVVSNNIVENATNVGIDVDGLNAGSAVGVVKNITVANNVVDGVTSFFGVWFANGVGLKAIGNVVKSTGAAGIRVCPATTGTTTDVIVSDNTISAANTAASTNSGIDVCGAANNVQIGFNTITGTTHQYAVHIASNVTNTSIASGQLTTGTSVGNLTPAIEDDGINSSSFALNPYSATFGGHAISTVFGQCHIPFILVSSGSMGNNGALSGLTTLPTTYPNAYVFLPAGAVSSGSAAAWYYFVGSSATAGTIFNNKYLSGNCSIPASPVAFVTTGPGAYTQTTATNITTYLQSVAGNTLGINGTIKTEGLVSYNATGNAHTIKGAYGNFTFGQAAPAANSLTAFSGGFSDRGATGVQVPLLNSSTFLPSQSTAAVSLGAVDSTVAQNLQIQLLLAVDTDFMVLENLVLTFIPGN